jgi:hypothetical protein
MRDKIPTLYSNFNELLLDLNIYGKMVSIPQLEISEKKEFLFEEFERQKPLPTMENERYKLSNLVSTDYKVTYEKQLELQENENLIDLEGMSDSISFDLDIDFDELQVPDSMQKLFSYEQGVTNSDRDSIISKFDLGTGDEFEKFNSKAEEVFDTVKKDQSQTLTDEQIDAMSNQTDTAENEQINENSINTSQIELDDGISLESEYETEEVEEDTEIEYEEDTEIEYEEEVEEDTEIEYEEEVEEDTDEFEEDFNTDFEDDDEDDDEEDFIPQVAQTLESLQQAVQVQPISQVKQTEDTEIEFEEDDSDEEEVEFEEDDSDEEEIEFEEDDSDDEEVEFEGNNENTEIKETSAQKVEPQPDVQTELQNLQAAYLELQAKMQALQLQAAQQPQEVVEKVEQPKPTIEEKKEIERVSEPQEPIEEPKQVVQEVVEPIEEQQKQEVVEPIEEPKQVVQEVIEEVKQLFEKDETQSTFVDSILDETTDDDIEFIPEENKTKVIETPKIPIKPVEVQPEVEERPTDLRAFLRAHPRCDYSLALQYFSEKEIKDLIKRGKVIKKGNTLRI